MASVSTLCHLYPHVPISSGTQDKRVSESLIENQQESERINLISELGKYRENPTVLILAQIIVQNGIIENAKECQTCQMRQEQWELKSENTENQKYTITLIVNDCEYAAKMTGGYKTIEFLGYRNLWKSSEIRSEV